LSIVKYRLSKFQKLTIDGDKTDYSKLLAEIEKAKNPDEGIAVFTKTIKNDALIKLANYLK
jgi:hypothetical protein